MSRYNTCPTCGGQKTIEAHQCRACANAELAAKSAHHNAELRDRRRRFNAAWDSGKWDHQELFYVLARADRLPSWAEILHRAPGIVCASWWRETGERQEAA